MDCHERPVPTGIVQASGLAACTNPNASLSTINVEDTLVFMRRTDMLCGPASLFLDFNFANALLQGGPYADTQPVFEFFVMDLVWLDETIQVDTLPESTITRWRRGE